ncbi:hypothetical protein SAMN05446037_10334 [Anaerovirgula multivorans]|uniref:Uncharacterized protein n=1 Tax=Anaerovirgula multivorans TaxID=312168 RepID=A0A239J3U2_9FIRM|nr:hypothetical protein [Anaerovirgula multivorans]SNT00480.1 hypothetical protein SAMN05446037_10334 [Anaerovirgula multivorans]
MSRSKIINLNEYIEKKKKVKTENQRSYKNKTRFTEEEERLKTLNLFMRVLATMEKESY